MHVGWNIQCEVGLPEDPSYSLVGILAVCVTKWENVNEKKNGTILGVAMVTERVLIKLVANAPLVLFDDSLHATASLSSRTVSTDGFRGALRWLHLLSYHQ